MTEALEMPLHLWRDGFGPAAELERLRIEAPITRIQLPDGASAWLITRHADIRAVLGDAARFSNHGLPQDRRSDGENDRSPFPAGFFLAYDPPEHTRLRQMLAPEFTAAGMRQLQPRVETVVAECLDRMAEADPPVDLITAFALPVPSLVICELLGVPYESRAKFQARSHKRLDAFLSPDELGKLNLEFHTFMTELVARQRKKPDENLIGTLIRKHGDDLTDEELAGIADLLLFNGHESTANMLGIGTLLLLRHPDQLARLRSEPAAVAGAVEELLRYLSVVNSAMPRTALEDVTIAGQVVKQGEQVFCSLTTANRDEALGEGLGSLDLSRTGFSHVAFGHGIHYCIGAPLARMEMRIAYPALLRWFPGLRLAVPFDEVPFRSYSYVHGIESLPVTW
ncbi:MAG: cytochrome P450 [Streptosporangiaceae bacterium]|nr:cytochrome P450 [Streptosporangiaceae bacterium]